MHLTFPFKVEIKAKATSTPPPFSLAAAVSVLKATGHEEAAKLLETLWNGDLRTDLPSSDDR